MMVGAVCSSKGSDIISVCFFCCCCWVRAFGNGHNELNDNSMDEPNEIVWENTQQNTQQPLNYWHNYQESIYQNRMPNWIRTQSHLTVCIEVKWTITEKCFIHNKTLSKYIIYIIRESSSLSSSKWMENFSIKLNRSELKHCLWDIKASNTNSLNSLVALQKHWIISVDWMEFLAIK